MTRFAWKSSRKNAENNISAMHLYSQELALAKQAQTLVPCYMFHGLFGMGVNLITVAKMIQEHVHPVLFDIPNHGRSPHLSPGDFEHTQVQVDNSIAANWEKHFPNTAKIHLLGHSLGAKYAMGYALRYPQKVSSLVVMDIAPMEYPPLNRVYIEAYKYLLKQNPTNRKEALRILSEYESNEALLMFLAKNIYFDSNELKLYLNLKEIDAHYDDLRSFPLEYEGRTYDGKALFLRAENTEYFTEESETHIRKYFTNYTVAQIPRSSHVMHIDNPERVKKELCNFYEAVLTT